MLKPNSEESLIERIKGMREESTWNTFSALVMGAYGSGKTSLFRTARLPVLLDSFDPKGTVVLEDMEREGKIIIRRFWDEDSSRPSQYIRWRRLWEEDLRTGTLEKFGTYGIDSITTFIEALTNYIAAMKQRDSNIPIERDYSIIYNHVRDVVKKSSSAGCDFIITAHIAMDRDEISGEYIVELDTYKRLKTRLPILFSEKYVVDRRIGKDGKPKVVLLTGPQGKYRGSTQLGKDGKFEIEEEPDIKSLLRKAGLPDSDKPLLKSLLNLKS